MIETLVLILLALTGGSLSGAATSAYLINRTRSHGRHARD